MIVISTDVKGVRWFQMPKALVDVATELFPDQTQRDAVFRLADSLSASDLHTAEQIAINCDHKKAIDFVRRRVAEGHTPKHRKVSAGVSRTSLKLVH